MSSEICNTTETTAYGWAVRVIHAEARTFGMHDEASTGIPGITSTASPVVTSALSTVMAFAIKPSIAVATTTRSTVALNQRTRKLRHNQKFHHVTSLRISNLIFRLSSSGMFPVRHVLLPVQYQGLYRKCRCKFRLN